MSAFIFGKVCRSYSTDATDTSDTIVTTGFCRFSVLEGLDGSSILRTSRWTKTMSLNQTKTWLAAWALTLLAVAPAAAQGLADMQLFAPAEVSTCQRGSAGSGR